MLNCLLHIEQFLPCLNATRYLFAFRCDFRLFDFVLARMLARRVAAIPLHQHTISTVFLNRLLASYVYFFEKITRSTFLHELALLVAKILWAGKKSRLMAEGEKFLSLLLS